MKTSAIWTLVLMVAVAGGAVAYFQFAGSPESAIEESQSTAESENETVESQAGTFSGTFADLAKRGGNYICTVDHSTDVTRTSGTTYIAGDRIRGDFSSQVQGFNVDSHMVMKEGFIYTWSSMAPAGFKIPAGEAEGDADAQMQAQYADMKQSYEYDCSPWSVDESKFTLPSITFQAI